MAAERSKEPREQFGKGRLVIDPAKAVFINCPYDPDFAPRFDALVFATVCCGFLPRSALESGNVAAPRMERILDAIFSSNYSLHDLSRCRGEGDERLARFNMPLELGIAMARQRIAAETEGASHDWAVMVPEDHAYGKFISDLAGYDLLRYDGREESIVPAVMGWLATRDGAVKTSTPQKVLAALPRFRDAKQRLQEEWQRDPPWVDLVLAALGIFGSL